MEDSVQWRAAFLVNVPISAALLASARWLREDRATHQVRLDVQGTLLAMLGVGLVVYPLITGGRWPVLAAGVLVSSWFAGRYLGPRSTFGGLALLLAGIACYRFAPASPWLLGALAIGGLGLGLFTVPFFTTALSHVRPHETGSAAGLLNAVQQLGAALGIAVLGSVFLHGHSAEHAFWLAAALVAATAVTTALLRPAEVPLT